MKYLLTIATFSLIFVACENPEMEKRISELEQQNEELAKEAAEKDSVLQAFDETFSMITRNLAMIRESEESIRLESQDIELSGDQRAAIEQEIQDINALLQANKDQIADLNKTIKRYQGEVGQYKNMISGLEEQIASKDREIEDLKQNLVAANFTIDILNKMNEELANEIRSKQGKIEEITDDANTVYYVIGTFKELKEKEIAERAGILAGKKLQEGFNKEDFVAIDKREVKSIQLSTTDAEIISNHPESSYEFQGETDEDYQLFITDANEFWKATNYLVVQVK